MRVTLDVEPAYEVRQHVFEDMSWPTLVEHFDAVMASGYSVSAFSRWGENVEQVWVKSRLAAEAQSPPRRAVRCPRGDRPLATRSSAWTRSTRLHSSASAGPWSDRLPHFRMGFTPSNGDELQSEYLMPRRHASAAIEAMLTLSKLVSPLVQVAEIRTVAADRLWMSPAYEQDVVAFHFTWVPDEAAVGEALTEIERVLAPFRPDLTGASCSISRRRRSPRCTRVTTISARSAVGWDPRDALRNAWLTRTLGERRRAMSPAPRSGRKVCM